MNFGGALQGPGLAPRVPDPLRALVAPQNASGASVVAHWVLGPLVLLCVHASFCWQWRLCVVGLPVWWVWCMPWALGVGLVSVFVASAVLRCPWTRMLLWCVLRCAAPLWASFSFVCLGVCAALSFFGVCYTALFRCVPLSTLCAWALRCPAPLWCVLRCTVLLCACVGSCVLRCVVCCAASTKNGGHSYTGTATHLYGGQVLVTSKALGCRQPPAGGAGSKPPPANTLPPKQQAWQWTAP